MTDSVTPSVFEAHVEAHARIVQTTLDVLARPVAVGADLLVDTLASGGKVLVFGNGGSAAQASHLAGELVGRFAATRRALPALALGSDPGVVTCIGNDFGWREVFARQIEALARPGDLALGLTTSGRSANVVRGLEAARAAGARTAALTGAAGLADGTADLLLAVPSDVTAHVQEVHLLILHVWCRAVDAAF